MASNQQLPPEAFEPFTRGDTKPARQGWYERKYPLIAGQHQHPCPFDFWDGRNWFPGLPDQSSPLRVKHIGMGVKQDKAPAKDQSLPWRRAHIHKIEILPPQPE